MSCDGCHLPCLSTHYFRCQYLVLIITACEQTREKVNLTASNAILGATQNKSGTQAVTTWISLCGGYQPSFAYDENNFAYDWDWERMYSWKAGYELDNTCDPVYCRDRNGADFNL